MNSMSRPHCNDDKAVCCRTEKETEVLLKCGTSNSVVVPVVPPAIPAISRLATLSLNSAKFNNKCIKFEFSTNIISTLSEGTELLTIRFQLFKICRDEITPVAIGGPWVFTRPVTISDIITFAICDCDCNCDTCCSYYVEAESSIITEGGSANIIFSNSTFSALLVENIIRCC